jgi:UDP-N-acetylmuramate dehydrogenase
MQIEERVPLAPYTTFHIGGPARYFARVESEHDFRNALGVSKLENLETLILGGGSNTLVTDDGFDGLVIKIEIGGIEKEGDRLIAGAGESWDALVACAAKEKLWGLENLSGIPGTVGGGVAGNIGAYGQALSQTLQWVEVFDIQAGEVKKMTNAECSFDYRDSFFKHDNGRHVILRAAFVLSSEGEPDISYKDLAARFSDSSQDIAAIREAVLAIRKGKFPDLTLEGTAGSFFKNPILSSEEAEKLKERYPEMPLFAMPETVGIKIPLAWLLDHALGLKGTHVGGARLFEKQPLVIAASLGASAHDVRTLAEMVKEKVRDALGIELEAEVKIIS